MTDCEFRERGDREIFDEPRDTWLGRNTYGFKDGS